MTQEHNDSKSEDFDWEKEIEKAKASVEPKEDVVVEESKEEVIVEPPVTEKKPIVENKNTVVSDKTTDAKYVMSMVNTSEENVVVHVNEVLGELDKDQRRAILTDRDHYISRLLQTDNAPHNTPQANFATMCMGATEDPSSFRVSDKDKTSKGKSNYNKELTGKTAAMAFTARVKGIKKVYLYNSGFYVCLRPMDLSELDEFYMEVDQNGEELGRIIGGLMFLIHDTHLKAKFMELLQTTVIDSNLIGWDKKDALAKNISIQDLDTLYWAVCSMMHKNGIKLDLICGHKECQHISPNQVMDVNRMRIVDTSSMSQEALKLLISDEPVRWEELGKYRSDLLDMTGSFTSNHIKYDLKVPTIYEVLNYNKTLMAEVVANANEDHTVNNARIMRSIMINYNRNFTPWISRVSYLDEDGNVEFSARDIEGIHSALALNDDSEDEGTIIKEVTDFMKKTKLSHVGYAVLKCEKCGKSSTDSISGYKAWDAQSLFMCLTSLKLGQIGMA